MVFLDKNSEKTVLNRHFQVNCNSLQLINNWSGEVFTFGGLIDLSESSFFYEFALDLSMLSEGEYTIKLRELYKRALKLVICIITGII